jgi:alpha-L-glutamate ligase-like protein
MHNLTTYLDWLRHRRILCMNKRNASFIAAYNPRADYGCVDEKLRTKTLAVAAGVPCPATYGVVRYWHEIDPVLRTAMDEYTTLVIKPNRGAAGRGVLVLERHGAQWAGARETVMSYGDVRYHVTSILSGLYSLSELPDDVILEQRIFPHPFMRDMTWRGTPDLRIILFRTIPVLAMMRLPTRRSDGRANLHQGAVGLGVSIADGVTRAGVCLNRRVAAHPDTGAVLTGRAVPAWPRTVAISRCLAHRIPLGYIGIDIMLDARLGPMVIEANARPGLGIQIANSIGLRPRLDFLRQRFAHGADPDELWPQFLDLVTRGVL